MSKNETPTKVIVPCRFSYLHCWEPEAINGGEPKYSVSAIIPKSDKETIKKIQAAVEAAKQESLSKWGGKIPPNLKLPLRDGDIDDRRMRHIKAVISLMPTADRHHRWLISRYSQSWIRQKCIPAVTEESV